MFKDGSMKQILAYFIFISGAIFGWLGIILIAVMEYKRYSQ